MTVELSPRQRQFLRGLAHRLEPVVHLGKEGLTEALLAEIDRALEVHELIKVRFLEGKEEKDALVAEIAARAGCAEVGRVGHVAILYRPQPDLAKRKVHLFGR